MVYLVCIQHSERNESALSHNNSDDNDSKVLWGRFQKLSVHQTSTLVPGYSSWGEDRGLKSKFKDWYIKTKDDGNDLDKMFIITKATNNNKRLEHPRSPLHFCLLSKKYYSSCHMWNVTEYKKIVSCGWATVWDTKLKPPSLTFRNNM